MREKEFESLNPSYVTPTFLLASSVRVKHKGGPRSQKYWAPRETPVAKSGPTFWECPPPPMAFTLPKGFFFLNFINLII